MCFLLLSFYLICSFSRLLECTLKSLIFKFSTFLVATHVIVSTMLTISHKFLYTFFLFYSILISLWFTLWPMGWTSIYLRIFWISSYWPLTEFCCSQRRYYVWTIFTHTSDTKCLGFFPHTNQFSNSPDTIYNSIQFWHWLLRISTEPTSKGLSPTRLPHFTYLSWVLSLLYL